jgi:hypothetical protein
MTQPHPAPYSVPILARFSEMLRDEGPGIRAVDPFGGVARLLAAMPPDSYTTIIEIEPVFVHEGWEWLSRNGHLQSATLAEPYVMRNGQGVLDNGGVFEYICDDSRDVLRRRKRLHSHIITSPSYGNRLKDKWNPTPGRVCRSYGQSIGGELQDGNAALYGFNDPEYWSLHAEVMALAIKRLTDDGKIILNVSDFYRTPPKKRGEEKKAPERIPVVLQWTAMLAELGMVLLAAEPVYTRRFKRGENRHRVPNEMILTFERA